MNEQIRDFARNFGEVSDTIRQAVDAVARELNPPEGPQLRSRRERRTEPQQILDNLGPHMEQLQTAQNALDAIVRRFQGVSNTLGAHQAEAQNLPDVLEAAPLAPHVVQLRNRLRAVHIRMQEHNIEARRAGNERLELPEGRNQNRGQGQDIAARRPGNDSQRPAVHERRNGNGIPGQDIAARKVGNERMETPERRIQNRGQGQDNAARRPGNDSQRPAAHERRNGNGMPGQDIAARRLGNERMGTPERRSQNRGQGQDNAARRPGNDSQRLVVHERTNGNGTQGQGIAERRAGNERLELPEGRNQNRGQGQDNAARRPGNDSQRLAVHERRNGNGIQGQDIAARRAGNERMGTPEGRRQNRTQGRGVREDEEDGLPRPAQRALDNFNVITNDLYRFRGLMEHDLNLVMHDAGGRREMNNEDHRQRPLRIDEQLPNPRAVPLRADDLDVPHHLRPNVERLVQNINHIHDMAAQDFRHFQEEAAAAQQRVNNYGQDLFNDIMGPRNRTPTPEPAAIPARDPTAIPTLADILNGNFNHQPHRIIPDFDRLARDLGMDQTFVDEIMRGPMGNRGPAAARNRTAAHVNPNAPGNDHRNRIERRGPRLQPAPPRREGQLNFQYDWEMNYDEELRILERNPAPLPANRKRRFVRNILKPRPENPNEADSTPGKREHLLSMFPDIDREWLDRRIGYSLEQLVSFVIENDNEISVPRIPKIPRIEPAPIEINRELLFISDEDLTCVVCTHKNRVGAVCRCIEVEDPDRPSSIGGKISEHFVCQTCIEPHCKSQCDLGRLAGNGVGVACTMPGCKRILLWAHVQAHLTDDTAKRMNNLIDHEATRDIEDIEHCKMCNFALTIVEDKQTRKVFFCENCKVEFCRICKKNWSDHIGKLCGELVPKTRAEKIADLKEKMSNAIIRRCVCGLVFRKIDGCNHLTCPSCKREMCNLCRSTRVDARHFATNRCSLFGNANIVDRQDLNDLLDNVNDPEIAEEVEQLRRQIYD